MKSLIVLASLIISTTALSAEIQVNDAGGPIVLNGHEAGNGTNSGKDKCVINGTENFFVAPPLLYRGHEGGNGTNQNTGCPK